MNSHSRCGRIGIALLAYFLAAVGSALAQQNTDLKVHFIDVGTGDCIWIQTGDDGIDNDKLKGLNIIIDGGDNGRIRPESRGKR